MQLLLHQVRWGAIRRMNFASPAGRTDLWSLNINSGNLCQVAEGRSIRQQAVGLVLEVQQDVVVGFGAHNHLIGRWEVVVSFAVHALSKLGQVLRGSEEFGGGLSPGRVDAR